RGRRPEVERLEDRCTPTATITATKDDGIPLTTYKNPGDTLQYTVVVANTGNTSATNVVYSDALDPNTTLVAGSVHASPLAFNDSYNAVGNTLLKVGPVTTGTGASTSNANGVLANDVTINAPGGTDTTSVVSHTNPANGTLLNFDNATGSFTYLA